MRIFGKNREAAHGGANADGDVRARLRSANAVCIDGVDYELNTDWSVWLEIDSLLSGRAADGMRLAKALTLAYPVLPHSLLGAVRGMLMFFSGGEECAAEVSSPPAPHTRVCDLGQDFEYIWGAFLSEYGIDLTETGMHWWRFRTLLSCLGKDCRYSQIVMYRSVDLTKIKDAEQRRFYAEMKKRYRLRDMRSAEEREADCAAELGKVF